MGAGGRDGGGGREAQNNKPTKRITTFPEEDVLLTPVQRECHWVMTVIVTFVACRGMPVT